jgi:hypothetical protein
MIGFGNSMFLATHGILARSASGGGVDADAQAFITAASITDPTQQSAINQLVVDLKGYGLWTKIYAAYPIVGGTASSHAVNLKTPGTRNLTFTVGWTHSANGMTPNGAAYANSNFNPVTVGITKTNFGVSAYSRTNIVQSGCLIGIVSGTSYIDVRPRLSSTIDFLGCYDDSNALGNYLTDSLGLFTASRSGTTQKFYQGATEKSQRTGFAATADINGTIYIGARNFVGVGIDAYSTKQTAWVAFHEFFDATQMNNYNTAIQAYQTTLNRQV